MRSGVPTPVLIFTYKKKIQLETFWVEQKSDMPKFKVH